MLTIGFMSLFIIFIISSQLMDGRFHNQKIFTTARWGQKLQTFFSICFTAGRWETEHEAHSGLSRQASFPPAGLLVSRIYFLDLCRPLASKYLEISKIGIFQTFQTSSNTALLDWFFNN